MNTKEEEFLRLLKASFEVLPLVLRHYIKDKIINPKFNESFIKFIDKMKHDLYHESNESDELCCFCDRSGTSRKKRVEKWIFRQLFEKITDRKTQCIGKGVQNNVSNTKRNKCTCICQYIPSKNNSLEKLDVTVLCVLLQVGGHYTKEVESIKDFRNRLYHQPDSNTLEFTTEWQQIEISVLHLAGEINVFYQELISKQLKEIKANELGMNEQCRIQEKWKEIMETSSKWKEDMEHRQEMAQQELDQLKIEVDKIKGIFPVKEGMLVANISLNIHLDSKQLLQTNGQWIHMSGQVQMSEDVQEQATPIKLTATIKNEPTSWDLGIISNNLNETSATELNDPDDFKLCASKTESIVIELTAARTLFRDQHTIKSALYSLLMKIIDAGKIDTNIPASITIKIENKATSKTEQSPELSSNIFENPESSATSSLIQPAMAMFEISFLQNIVLDVFPQIIREWIVRFLTDIKPKQSLKDLDLKSLYHIIQTSSLIKPPISGWHLWHPQPTEITPSDDLIRMMCVRGKVYRRPNSFVSKEEWDGHFTDILDVVKRFDKHLQKQSDECFERQTSLLFNYWTFAMLAFQGPEDFEYALSTASPSESVERSHKDKPYWSSVTTTTSKASTDSGLGSERVIFLQKHPQKKQRQSLMKDTLTRNQFFTPPDIQMKESLEETAEFQAQSSDVIHSESDDEDIGITHF